MRPSASPWKGVIKTTPHQSTSDKWGVPSKGHSLAQMHPSVSPLPPQRSSLWQWLRRAQNFYNASQQKPLPVLANHFPLQGLNVETTGQPLIRHCKKNLVLSCSHLHDIPHCWFPSTSVETMQPMILLFQQRLPLYATFVMTAMIDVKALAYTQGYDKLWSHERAPCGGTWLGNRKCM